MRTSDEIVAAHTAADGTVNLAGATREFLAPAVAVQLGPADYLNVLNQHVEAAVLWLADLVFELLQQQGALPLGKEQELATAREALRFDYARRLYDAIARKAQPKLLVPGK